jgi:hypothetical protein
MALKRMGLPDKDIAPLAMFLTSEEGSYLTGYTFNPDSGFLIDSAR